MPKIETHMRIVMCVFCLVFFMLQGSLKNPSLKLEVFCCLTSRTIFFAFFVSYQATKTAEKDIFLPLRFWYSLSLSSQQNYLSTFHQTKDALIDKSAATGFFFSIFVSSVFLLTTQVNLREVKEVSKSRSYSRLVLP